jgi:hypothetical protein
MRAYTLSILAQLANSDNPMVEKEIVTWVNNKLNNAGKSSSIKSFQVNLFFGLVKTPATIYFHITGLEHS